MQGNIIGQSGMFVNDSLFPIYQQLNQPIEYNGIWIKTEDNLKDVYFQTDMDRESINISSLPYNFMSGRAVAIGNDIYMFGGDHNKDLSQNAYKYNSVEKTYTKLTNISTTHYFEDGQIVVIDGKIYLIGSEYSISQSIITAFNPETGTYTYIDSLSFFDVSDGAAVVIENDIYLFGGNYNQANAEKYNIITKEETQLKGFEYGLSSGFAIAKNSNEIYIFGVSKANNIKSVTKYDVQEDEYQELNTVLALDSSYGLKVKKAAYFGAGELTKYFIENDTYYQYKNKTLYTEGINSGTDDIQEIVNIGNDLYVLTRLYLRKLDIKPKNEGDGIYVILQDLSIYKELDTESVLDVKKIVDGEEQDILVYIGDGESWKLLNGSDTTQTTNALQYALSFKEES